MIKLKSCGFLDDWNIKDLMLIKKGKSAYLAVVDKDGVPVDDGIIVEIKGKNLDIFGCLAMDISEVPINGIKIK